MEEYLTTKELAARIKHAPGTLRNMVCRGVFTRNIHYVKAGGRLLLWKWSGVYEWLHGHPMKEGDHGQAH